MMRAILAVLLLILAPPAAAQVTAGAAHPILRAEALDLPTESAQQLYRQFLLLNGHRAFVRGRGSSTFYETNRPSQAEAVAAALKRCEDGNGAPCRVMVIDNRLAGPRAPAPHTPALPAGQAGQGWDLRPESRLLAWGPAVAKGVVVWAHGVDQDRADLRERRSAHWVNAFNTAGWDVWRFDREPIADRNFQTMAAAHAELPQRLRAMGYRRVVLAGQSRGGWTALATLAAPNGADAVIAQAPARHGTPDRNPNFHARALPDFTSLIAQATSPRTTVIVALFDDDPYDPDPAARATLVRHHLNRRPGTTLVLDRPGGITGHGGGSSIRFATEYARCLVRVVETPPGGPANC